MIRKQVAFQKENLFTYKPKGEWIASVSIDVGHSEEAEGAENQSHTLTEFDYNTPVAHSVAQILQEFGVLTDVYQRDLWGEYSSMQDTKNFRSMNVVDRYEADIPLHLNSYNGKAHGTEILHHHNSSRGKLLASCLLGPITANFGTSKHRGGIVPLYSGDRAYSLVSRPIDPTGLIEAGYIDNPTEEIKLRTFWLSYDEAIVDGLIRYFKAIGIEDPRFDKWKWKPGQNLSNDIKEMINGMDSNTCPVCNRIDCGDYRDYRKNSPCKNR